MKKLYSLAVLGFGLLMLASCAKGPDVEDPQLFKTKTGVIGVFRQPAFYCSEANPHYMQLGSSTVVVKPTWSEDQDNLFVTELPPGNATLLWYSYTCGESDNKFVLDTAESAANPGPIGVIVPEKGFCKTVISFVQGDKLFANDNVLIKEHATKEEVAANMDDIPFCEVFDNTGAKVSFANRDSLLAAQYVEAVKDAADAQSEEIYPLLIIDSTVTNDRVVWNEDKTKVLMATFHGVPDVYEDGKTVKLEQPVWVMSERELYLWYKDHKKGVRNWPLRLRQLVGLPKDERVTHFSLFWVPVDKLIRPAYVTDIKSPDMRTSFADELESDENNTDMMMWYKNWFDDNYAKSYQKDGKGYPWTRLGYTYDWGAKGSNKYGVSEFLVLPETEVDVRFTKNTKSFVQWLEERNN